MWAASLKWELLPVMLLRLEVWWLRPLQSNALTFSQSAYEWVIFSGASSSPGWTHPQDAPLPYLLWLSRTNRAYIEAPGKNDWNCHNRRTVVVVPGPAGWLTAVTWHPEILWVSGHPASTVLAIIWKALASTLSWPIYKWPFILLK